MRIPQWPYSPEDHADSMEAWKELLRQILGRVPEDSELDAEVPKGRCSDVWSRLWDMQFATTNYDLDQL